MIQVRTIFHTKWGKANEVIAGMKESAASMPREGRGKMTLLSDLSGDTYTVVVEAEFESLAAWEKYRAEMFSSPELLARAEQGQDLFLSGRNEYYTIEGEI